MDLAGPRAALARELPRRHARRGLRPPPGAPPVPGGRRPLEPNIAAPAPAGGRRRVLPPGGTRRRAPAGAVSAEIHRADERRRLVGRAAAVMAAEAQLD